MEMDTATYEGAHQTSILDLIGEFPGKEDEIERLYLGQRTLLEMDAKIKDFLPIFTYQIVRHILMARYVKGYLEEKVQEIEEKFVPKPQR
ncbi:MAG: hypothetical protein U9O94_01145 [Nanoarchaeota archaeon]|nr:hypothetical protein [Nanoarchaeota archaeon]